PNGAINESDETNNQLVLADALNVQWAFGNLPGQAGSQPLTLTDADGTQVTFTLSGAGRGDVTPSAGGFDLALTGTDAASAVTLTAVGGDGRATLHNLTINGSLLALNAPS